MIIATARLLGTITATAVIFSTQTGSCAAATVTVNSQAYDTVTSGGTLNVPVENTEGTAYGSKVGADWQLPDETFRTYINGVLQSTDTIPALKSETININFV